MLSFQMDAITLKTPTVFSFTECLNFLARSKKECLFSVEKEKIRKLFFAEGSPVLVELKYSKPGLELVFLNYRPGDKHKIAIKNYIRNWLDLDSDLAHFYNIAKTDRYLSSLVKKHHGLPLIGIPDFYEALCWAIIGQQINLAFAYSIKRNIVEYCGRKFEFEGKIYYTFPEPAQILSISDESFRRFKFSRQKASYLKGISQKIMDKTLDFNLLRSLDYESAKAKLTAIQGIGNWTADYVLMKTFRFPNAFPPQDAGFQNALKIAMNLSGKPDPDTICQVSKPWKGVEAYATFYLWRSLFD